MERPGFKLDTGPPRGSIRELLDLKMKTSRYWLISYDIADPKRLRRVARAVAAVGERLHYSLFLCRFDEDGRLALQRRIARLIDAQVDSVHYLPWCDADRRATLHLGASREPGGADAWIV